MAKINTSLIAYGPTLPAENSVADGSLFYRTETLVTGVLSGATTTTLTLDKTVVLNDTTTITIWNTAGDRRENLQISNTGTTNTVELSTPLASAPTGYSYQLMSGTKGLFVYGFMADSNTGAGFYGPQSAQGWMSANLDQGDAGTLDGHDSSYFQPQHINLDALSSLSTTGFYVVTALGTSTTRAITVGSSKLTISNGSGVAGNPVLDISVPDLEAALSLGSIPGTLSVAKGGTNSTSTTVGGVLYGASSTQISTSAAGTSGQVLTSAGASAPVWVNQSTLSVGSAVTANTANSATTATTATIAGSVPWTGVTGKPTTISGFGITDAYTKTEVNTLDYINYPPFAGVLKENQVPVSSTFGMSQTLWASSSFAWVDNTGKTVLFFVSDTPVAENFVYRAYRFNDTDPFIFDAEPVSATFLNPGEKVLSIVNMGTNFAVLGLSTTTVPEAYTRHVLVKTGGSSKWQDWVYAYDVSSLIIPSGARANLFLLETSVGDRILQYYVQTSQATAEIRVYDSSFTLLRTQEIYNRAADLTNIDQTAAGRTTPTGMTILNYAPYGRSTPFTWNKFTETLHIKNHTYYVQVTSAGANQGVGLTIDFSWSMPRAWIESGAGTPANLIPVKSSGYRYHQLSDTTWDTDDGGMSVLWGGSGFASSIVTDEYTGNMTLMTKSSFNNVDVGIYRRLGYNGGFIYKTFGGNNTVANGRVQLAATYNAPDGSPWSKQMPGYWFQAIGDSVRLRATSTRYGSVYVHTTMSLTSFNSVSRANDTIILDGGNFVVTPTGAPTSVANNFFNGAFGVVVDGAGVPTYYHSAPGSPVYTITASGTTRTYTDTTLVMPALPATISGITMTIHVPVVAWNGSIASPIYWTLFKDPTNNVHMAKNVGGAWTVPGSPLLTAQITAGNTNRGDTSNACSISNVSGQTVLTANGRILFNFIIPYTGSSGPFWASYNTNTDTEEVGALSRFPQLTTSGKVYRNNEGGASFGYTQELGYYRAIAPDTQAHIRLACSRDLVGSGADLTEDQWFNHTAAQYELFISTESATGLVAYTSSYPLFLGGYYSTVPAQAVTLQPSTDNYIYVTRDAVDRTLLTVSTSTTLLPSSNTRALIAKITTDTTNVVSQVLYEVAQHDTIEQLENVDITAKAVGDTLTWNGTSWVATPVQASLVPTGTVAYFFGTTPPVGWMIANGATFSATTYSALAAVLGGNVLPDLRGVFIRGLDLGAGLDPSRTLNTYQADSFASHTHGVLADNGGFNTNSNNVVSGTDRGAVYTAQTTATGGTETRPKNVSLLPIIKY